ncbi:MAG: PH domain-containing protein [Verrucomicrobiota bacterium]
MALIKCPECGGQVSTEATACPACGYPVGAKQAAPANNLLLEIRPSWWGYIWYLLFAWLLIPLLIAWLKRKSIVLRVYEDRVAIERGLVTKCYREFFIHDLRSIDVDQGLWGRMVGIGNLTISTAATVEAAETLCGLPDPKAIRDLLIARRQGA